PGRAHQPDRPAFLILPEQDIRARRPGGKSFHRPSCHDAGSLAMHAENWQTAHAMRDRFFWQRDTQDARHGLQQVPPPLLNEKQTAAGLTMGTSTAMFRKILKDVLSKVHPVDVSSLYTEVPRSAGKIPNHVYQTWISPVLPFLHARV